MLRLFITKRRGEFRWSKAEQAAFDMLKQSMCSTPVPQLRDLTKPFEIHNDASDLAYGVVLMQNNHPVAYDSKFFSEIEKMWSTHEKEMLAIVKSLHKWRHLVQDKPTMVFTENLSLQYLSQPKLSPK